MATPDARRSRIQPDAYAETGVNHFHMALANIPAIPTRLVVTTSLRQAITEPIELPPDYDMADLQQVITDVLSRIGPPLEAARRIIEARRDTIADELQGERASSLVQPS